jgi:hypothetical protein
MAHSLQASKSFSGTNRYLPGLTMPTGHHPSDLNNPDDPKEVENAYIEVRGGVGVGGESMCGGGERRGGEEVTGRPKLGVQWTESLGAVEGERGE